LRSTEISCATLESIPDGLWLCPTCVQQGHTIQEAERRAAERDQLAEQEAAPVLFPNSAMKKRDDAAEAKHGRLVKKLFFDPITKQRRFYWGRVHFQGAMERPNYYMIVYEDGDTQTMGNRQLNQVLQPEGTCLPAGVSVPQPPPMAVAAAVHQFQSAPVQQVIRSQAGELPRIPYCEIPQSDLLQLTTKMQWRVHHDPITHYPGWFDMPYGLRDPVPNESWPVHLPLPQGSPIYLAPALQYVLQALHLALKLKPVLVICYIPALRVPTPVWQLARAWLDQGFAALFRAEHGWWLIVSRRPVPVHRWIRLDVHPTGDSL